MKFLPFFFTNVTVSAVVMTIARALLYVTNLRPARNYLHQQEAALRYTVMNSQDGYSKDHQQQGRQQ